MIYEGCYGVNDLSLRFETAVPCSQEYVSRYNDFLLTANGLGLRTLDEQRYWEALAHRHFAPRLMTDLRTAASAAF